MSPNTGFDLASFPQAPEPTLVILTSPNNPTGATLPLAHLQTLLEKHPECVFVIDEAYGDFGGETALSLVQRHANLLVLRTFSQGYGLPSVRFGYAAGNTARIQLVKKYTIPFTVNCFADLYNNLKLALQANRILVAYLLQNCLRLTIGTEVEMHRVVRLLKKTMAQHKSRAIETDVVCN